MNAADTPFYRAFASRVRATVAATAPEGSPTMNDTTTVETSEAPTPIPATFQAPPDAPCEAHAWCTVTGTHADHFGRRVSLPTVGGRPPILTANFYTDEPAGLPELDYDPGHDDWREYTSGDQLRAETAKVRAHLIRLDALADEYDLITDSSQAGVLRRAAAYVAGQGVTPEQAKALDIVASEVIEEGDPSGAGRELATALTAHAGEDSAPMDCTDLASVRARLDRVAAGIVHAARLHADPLLSAPDYRVVPADGDDWFRLLHEAEVMDAASSDGTGSDAGIPEDEFHLRRLLALVQSYARLWGSGHGRTLKDEYTEQLIRAAEHLVREAVTASLAGLDTNPHDAADRLHRAIDNAQGRHLAEVGGHDEAQAYADSRLSTASIAAEDAMKATGHPAQMARALRTTVDMVIAEAGEQDGGAR